MNPIELKKLGKTDLEVSSIGLGCVTFGREIDRPTSHTILDHAIDRGITFFDTAAAYGEGESEAVLGEWIGSRRCRNRITLATKVTGRLSKQWIKTSAEESLRRLQVECIDLFQVHIWDASTPLEETLAGLNDLVREGKVRAVGCSNYSTWQLAKALLLAQAQGFTRIESVQPPYSLVLRDIETELLPLCADQQIGVISYSPLGAGFLTGKYRKGGPIPSGTRFDIAPAHQEIYFTPSGFKIIESLEKLAAERNQSIVELALAWVFSRPGITSVLIGARTTSHIDQAIAARAIAFDTHLDISERLASM